MENHSDLIELDEWKGRKIVLTLHCSEFVVGGEQGTLSITYVPGDKIIDTKSIRPFLEAFQDSEMLKEQIIDEIAESLGIAAKPQYIAVNGSFHPRGGVSVEARAERVAGPEEKTPVTLAVK